MTGGDPTAGRQVTWDELDALVSRLADAVGRDFDLLLAISRGGLVPAGMLAYRLDLREIALFLDAAVFEDRHVASRATRRGVAAHDGAQPAQSTLRPISSFVTLPDLLPLTILAGSWAIRLPLSLYPFKLLVQSPSQQLGTSSQLMPYRHSPTPQILPIVPQPA
jgi:hypothetical protein